MSTQVKTEHTPGPWQVADERDGVAFVIAEHLRIVVDHRENFGSAKADACLIAAAPDLLSAAKAAEPLLVGALAFVDCKPQLNQLRAAIAAAESKPGMPA